MTFHETKEFIELALKSTFKHVDIKAKCTDSFWSFLCDDLEISFDTTSNKWTVSHLVFHDITSPLKEFSNFILAFKLFTRLYIDYRISRVIEEEMNIFH